jgi:hypothetical protein
MELFELALAAVILCRLALLWPRHASEFAGVTAVFDGSPYYYRVRRNRIVPQAEFVALAIDCDPRWEFELRPETRWDRIAALLGWGADWRTGDPDFDRRVFIVRDEQEFNDALSLRAALRRSVASLFDASASTRLYAGRGKLWLVVPYRGALNIDPRVVADTVAPRALPELSALRAALEAALRDVRDGPSAANPRRVRSSYRSWLARVILPMGLTGLVVSVLAGTERLDAPRALATDWTAIVATGTALVVCAGLLFAAYTHHLGKSHAPRLWLDVLLIALPGAWLAANALGGHANRSWDKSLGQEIVVPITRAFIASSRAGRFRVARYKTYHVDSSAWPDRHIEGPLQVTRELYEGLASARCLRLRWHRGALGDPWVSSWQAVECRMAVGAPPATES